MRDARKAATRKEMTAIRMLRNRRGTTEDTVRTLIKLILFVIVLAVAIRFCVLTMQLTQDISKEHRRALSEVYQAVQHFDVQFDKTSRKVLLKTEDYTMRGYPQDQQLCQSPDKGCICLCIDDSCNNARNEPGNYCKTIQDYEVSPDFFIDKSDKYRRIEIKLVPTGEDSVYEVAVGTKEDATQE